MGSFTDAASQAVRSFTCQLLEEDENVVGLLRNTGLSGNPLRNAARTFRRVLCDNPDAAQSSEVPTATGGQCPVLYVVNSGDSWSSTTQGGGPSSRLFAQNEILSGPFSIESERNNIQAAVNYYLQTPSSGPRDELIYVKNDSLIGWVPFLNISRVDGQPDNCGNTDGPLYPRLPSVSGPINITYNDNNGTVVNDGFDLNVFAPVLISPGAFRFPIALSAGGVTINGNLNLNGQLDLFPDANIGFGSGGGNPDGAEPAPPDPGKRLIIGCRVFSEVLQNTKVSRIKGDSNPDIYIPRLASVQFLQTVGRGQSWSHDLDVKTLNAWIPCPDPGYATDVGVVFAQGVRGSVVPIYDTVEPVGEGV